MKLTPAGFSPGTAHLTLVVGGGLQAVAGVPHVANADALIVADVPDELAAISTGGDVFELPLGEGETVASLARRHADNGLEEFFSAHPGVDTEAGLGQVPACGWMAVEEVLQNKSFEDLLDGVLNLLLEKHDGRLKKVQIDAMGSGSGGTGTEGAPLLLGTFVRHFLKSTRAVIHARLLRVGSLSFTHCGRRVHVNCAAATERGMAWARGPVEDPRVVRSLVYFELPILGGQKRARDAYAVQFIQALLSTETQLVLSRRQANDRLASPLGNISLVRGQWGSQLGERDIASSVAGDYQRVLLEVLATPATPDAGTNIHVGTRRSRRKGVATVVDLVELAEQSAPESPADFFGRCLEPEFDWKADGIWVNVPGDSRAPLGVHLQQRATTVSAMKEKMALLEALLVGLVAKQEELAESIKDAKAQRDRAAGELQSFLPNVFPQSVFRSLWASALLSPEQAFRKLQSRINHARDRISHLNQLQTEKDAIDQAVFALRREQEADRGEVQHLVHLLGNLAKSAPEQELVRSAPLDSVLVPLFREARAASNELSERAMSLLASCCSEVTMPGLARIVGAPSERPFTVSEHIATAPPHCQGPDWGGKPRALSGTRIVVLPPMAESDRTALRSHLESLAPGLIVAFADWARGGANVVHLHCCVPRSREDVMTPLHATHVETARRQPHLHYGPNGHSQTSHSENTP